jgi:ABC-type Zn uptake system ZnuABC Zn-binding protein ZnuA
MKFMLTACVAGALAALPAAFGQTPDEKPAGINVLAAETFMADIAQNVAGDRVHVESMMPFGVDPHTYEPSPGDIRKVTQCQALIVNGAGYEEFQERLLKNAGGEHFVIVASEGLTSRNAREGEVAEMSDEDAADAITGSADGLKAQPVAAGKDPASAAVLPQESGLFTVELVKMEDGSFGGFIAYATDETADFQVAVGAGEARVLKAGSAEATAAEKTLALNAPALKRGYVVELAKGGKYVLALTGFRSRETPLLIGPFGEPPHRGDPHFWLDPNNVIRYTLNIRDGLSRADRGGAAIYARNAETYIAELKKLDAWIKEQAARVPAERRMLVTSHDCFGYFADRYGFRVIGTIVPSVSTEAAPSARQIARLVDRVRAAHAPAIFVEPETNPQLALQVARETGVKVVTDLYLETLSEPAGPAPTYMKMMRHNVTRIVETLLPGEPK